MKNKRPNSCHLLFYFTSYVLDMFRTLIYPSSGACEYSVELPHWSCCSWFGVCWSFGVVGLEWYPYCRLKHKFNMFRTLKYPSSVACDYSFELPHWAYCPWFDVCWSFSVVGLEWYPCCRLKHKLCFSLQHGYHSNPTTPSQEQYDQCGNSTE